MKSKTDDTIKQLQNRNKQYQNKHKDILPQHIKGQSPRIAVFTCADSRVIPEHIFQASIGELFVVRIAGNISIDKTVIESLEYAVNTLKITHLIILGHTHCGAIKAAEEHPNTTSKIITEIQKSFTMKNTNHTYTNLQRQIQMLPKRSKIIHEALSNKTLHLHGAIYHIEDGNVEFLHQ
jgi:carbonic anhydrase